MNMMVNIAIMLMTMEMMMIMMMTMTMINDEDGDDGGDVFVDGLLDHWWWKSVAKEEGHVHVGAGG